MKLLVALLLGISSVSHASEPVKIGPMDIVDAWFEEPTTRYDHGILGDNIEHGMLAVEVARCDTCGGGRQTYRFRLSEDHVFEDLAPRLADVNGDGLREVVVVETDVNLGARLAVFSNNGLMAATPYIGRSHRWLAPAGIADFDGDGQNDIAYVETPHLGKTLRFWTMRNGALVEIAAIQGLTNHRIGQDFISGGVRTCAGSIEVVTASGNWSHVVATRLENGTPVTTTIGPFTGPQSFADALICQ